MTPFFTQKTRVFAIAAGLACLAHFATAEPKHGIAMYGDPSLTPDFVSLPYANPDAPTGGRVVMGEVGSFDSLNPHQAKGNVPWQLRFLAYESLMARSYAEPFSLYGLLAESIEVAPDRSWAEFTLRPEARFSDGSPVTVADVMWSYETLGTQGHPRYLGAWKKVAQMEQTGPRSLRFTFNEADRELALLIGMRPILKMAQFDDIDFATAGLDTLPITSAPYVIDSYEVGRYVALKRDESYWGRDLAIRRGTNVIDEVRMEFYGDASVHFEAFKAGELNGFRESNAEKWETRFDFPAVQRGDVVKSAIPHQRPSGITGFAMNTRKAPFDDWRVRDALIHGFNFEFINQTLNGGKQPRITSYFSNSLLGMQDGPATGRVLDYLEPFADTLLPGTIEGYALPVSDGSERNRANLRTATHLLEGAGWTVQDGQMRNADGAPLTFDILLRQGSNEAQSMIDIYVQHLKRLGITTTVTVVDSAQYRERTDAFDFDMTYYRRGVSLSPGNEQFLYWGADAADQPGSRNLMGIKDPAVDALVNEIINAASNDDFVAATRALDRVLTAGRYVIPINQWNYSWIAHDARLNYPQQLPIYGDWIGFMPDVWWYEDDAE